MAAERGRRARRYRPSIDLDRRVIAMLGAADPRVLAALHDWVDSHLNLGSDQRGAFTRKLQRHFRTTSEAYIAAATVFPDPDNPAFCSRLAGNEEKTVSVAIPAGFARIFDRNCAESAHASLPTYLPAL